MGYITLPGGIPNVTQAIISVWFRIPQAAVDAALANYTPPTSGGGGLPEGLTPWYVQERQFNGIIPLMTFGSPQEVTPYTFTTIAGQSYSNTTYEWEDGSINAPICKFKEFATQILTAGIQVAAPTSSGPLNPSFIGVECIAATTDGDPPTITLKVNLQMDSSATIVGVVSYLSGFQATDPRIDYLLDQGSICANHPHINTTAPVPRTLIDGVPDTRGPEVFVPWYDPAIGHSTETYTYSDLSDTLGPEVFVLGGALASNPENEDPPMLTVTPGVWNHLLLSFDLSNPVSTKGNSNTEWLNPEPPSHADLTSSAAQAWIAFNQKNVDRRDLTQFWPIGNSPDYYGKGYADPNAILTAYGYATAASFQSPNSTVFYNEYTSIITQTTPHVRPSYDYDPSGGVPTDGVDVAFPSSPDFVDSILDVDMAEFQMWVGQTLDTSDPANVALFIDDKGKPVPPDQKASSDTGQTSGSIEALGQPYILLHGVGSWQNGKNTGTLGVNSDHTVNPDGQFTPQGTIIKFTPTAKYTGGPVTPTNPDSQG